MEDCCLRWGLNHILKASVEDSWAHLEESSTYWGLFHLVHEVSPLNKARRWYFACMGGYYTIIWGLDNTLSLEHWAYEANWLLLYGTTPFLVRVLCTYGIFYLFVWMKSHLLLTWQPNFREKELIKNEKDGEASSINRVSPLNPNCCETLDIIF